MPKLYSYDQLKKIYNGVVLAFPMRPPNEECWQLIYPILTIDDQPFYFVPEEPGHVEPQEYLDWANSYLEFYGKTDVKCIFLNSRFRLLKLEAGLTCPT